MRDFLLSLAVLAVFFAVMAVAWLYLLPYILPFVLAVFLALLIDPAVNGMESWLRVPRGVAVGIALLSTVAIGALIVVALVAVLRLELAQMVASLPEFYQRANLLTQRLLELLGAFSAQLPASAQEVMQEQLNAAAKSLGSGVSNLAGTLGALSALPGAIVTTIMTLVATFFISRDKRPIARFLLGLLPPAWKRSVNQAKADVFIASVGFVKAQMAVMFITVLLTIIGLNLIGSRYAVTLGLLVGLLDVLPVLGPSLVFIPWIALELILGDRVMGLWLLLLYGVLAGMRQVIEPKLVGDRIGLHPLATLIALYVGLQLFGGGGVIFGPLSVIVLKAVVRSGLLPIFRYKGEAA